MSSPLFQTIPWNTLSPRPSADPPAALFALSLAEEDLLLWQSRCPHDLRSGSLMAGELMGRATRYLVERCGAESLLYPVVETGIAGASAPFHLVAAVPAAWDAAALVSVLQTEWKRQVRLVWDWLKAQGALTDENARGWERSLDHGPRFVWQLWPWQATARAGELLRPLDAGDLLSPTERHDSWLWQANRRLLQHRWLSRWQTNDFSAGSGWMGGSDRNMAGQPKAMVEPMGRKAGRTELAAEEFSPELRAWFKTDEPLTAWTVFRRLWPRVVRGEETSPAELKNMPLAGSAMGATHLCRSADIPARLGIDENEEADKNVRPPIAQGLPRVNQREMCLSAVLIWRIGPGPSSLPRIAGLVAEARGALLHAAVDGGVALIPAVGALALARQFLRGADTSPDSELSLGLALPLGAVPFVRGIQSAIEAAEVLIHGSAPVLSRPRGLGVRVIDVSRCLAEWDAGSGGAALDYAADLEGAFLSTGSSSPTKLAARLREMLRVAEKYGWAENGLTRPPISWAAEWSPGFTAGDYLAPFQAVSQAYWTQLQAGVKNAIEPFCQWLKLLRYLTLRLAGSAKGGR